MTLTERIKASIAATDSMVCVGMDVDRAKMPQHIERGADGIVAFVREIAESTCDSVCAFKFNLAFFEDLGTDGWRILERCLDEMPAGPLLIADAKRGDIANTSAAYAHSVFSRLPFDACTVSPYMGFDSIEPFTSYPGKGAFVLCKTSNPDSGEFQNLIVRGAGQPAEASKPMYIHVAERVESWKPEGAFGLVVGATYPEELSAVREVAPQLPILIPGLGAQGGDVARSVQAALKSPDSVALFNSSRAIIYAHDGRDFAMRAREAAQSLRDEIRHARASLGNLGTH